MMRTKGMGGHHSAKAIKDEWLTPPCIIDALGPFDLDPCAPRNRPWPTASLHYTEIDDGLSLPWEGRVWCNPPYGSQAGVWLRRLADHGIGTALIFARTETKFFAQEVWNRATALLFLYGRLHFHHVTGVRAAHNAGAPSVLVAYGQGDAHKLQESGLCGKFVPLLLPRCYAVLAVAETPTWREAISAILNQASGPVRLEDLYRMLAGHPKTRTNKHWRAKVRQVLQRGAGVRAAPGVWRAA